MAKYIDKDALVAEIKRRRKLVSDPILAGDDLMIGERNALFNLLSFIDTLEVKEVDLEKEIKESIIDEWCDEWSGDVGNWIRYRRGTTSMTIEDVKDIAKHFFELGLKAQKGE